MSPFVYQRTDVYAPDAEMFRPERWIEASDEERKTMDKNLLTFGSGNRVCIGKVRC
jgi:cytochrome P450